MHGAGIHGFEDHRIGAVLQFDFETEIVFKNRLEDMRGHAHRRPVRHADHDIGRLDHAGGHHGAGQAGSGKQFSQLHGISPFLLAKNSFWFRLSGLLLLLFGSPGTPVREFPSFVKLKRRLHSFVQNLGNSPAILFAKC